MSLETLGTDINSKVDFSLPAAIAGQCVKTTLSAAVEQHTTTPPSFNRAFFSCTPGTNVFVAIGATAELPGSSFTVCQDELNPSIRQISIQGGQTISCISDTDAFVNIRYDQGL